eukprot:357999-Chlamydomonas_euryale.AAC.4
MRTCLLLSSCSRFRDPQPPSKLASPRARSSTHPGPLRPPSWPRGSPFKSNDVLFCTSTRTLLAAPALGGCEAVMLAFRNYE